MRAYELDEISEELENAIKIKHNVLLISSTGVGKSYTIKKLFDKHFKSWKYFSSATIDPWADLIGIPSPRDGADGEPILKFARPEHFNTVEAIFFDELTCSHHKVQNALLEIIDKKSLNGVPLPNLKVCWAACNPVEAGYYTDRLSKALERRFHFRIQLKPAVSEKYLEETLKINKELAQGIKKWWEALTDDLKKMCCPATVETIVRTFQHDMDMSLCFLPEESRIPLDELKKILCRSQDIIPDFYYLINNHKDIVKKFKEFETANDTAGRLNYTTRVLDALNKCKNLRSTTVVQIAPVIVEIPIEMSRKWVIDNGWKLYEHKDKVTDPKQKDWILKNCRPYGC